MGCVNTVFACWMQKYILQNLLSLQIFFFPLRVYCKLIVTFCDNLLFLCMHTGPKGLASSSWSADIGVSRHYNSPGLYHSGRDAGKSHSYSSLQQGKSKGCTGGKLMQVTSTVSLSMCHCTTFILPSQLYKTFSSSPGAWHCYWIFHICLQFHSQKHLSGCLVWLQDVTAGHCSCPCLLNSQGEGQGPWWFQVYRSSHLRH